MSLKITQQYGFDDYFSKTTKNNKKIIENIAFCLMPNHLHIILQQLEDNGISIYMNKVLNSYSRYFNVLHKRKGPLWESRFRHIEVESDEQLLHLTRYIHLNPTSAELVKKPEQWPYSSYPYYIDTRRKRIVNFENFISVRQESYRQFVNDRKDYQRKLSYIKKIIAEPITYTYAV